MHLPMHGIQSLIYDSCKNLELATRYSCWTIALLASKFESSKLSISFDIYFFLQPLWVGDAPRGADLTADE